MNMYIMYMYVDYVIMYMYVNVCVYVYVYVCICIVPPTPLWCGCCGWCGWWWVVVGGGGGGRSCICMYMNVYVWYECIFLVFIYDYDMICI